MLFNNFSKKLSYLIGMVIGLYGLNGYAVLEEVVVTAQKREQSMQDVGLSVTAFSGEQMRQLNFNDTADLVKHTPGLNYVTPFGAGNNVAFTLRGVGLNDFSESNEAPVAVYLDGVYNATLAGIGFQLFDMSRAEVLRGPQGTLYGRNSTGGLVHFITNKPTPQFEAYTDLTVGAYGQVRAEGAVGGALGERLSARASVLYHAHDGYQDSLTPGVDDPSETDNISGRLQFLYEINESADLLFSVHGGKSDQVAAAYNHTATMFGPNGVDAVPVPDNQNVYGTCPGCDLTGYKKTSSDFYDVEPDREPFVDIETTGSSLTLNWNMGDLDFKSITGYLQVDKFFGEDTDAGPQPFVEVTNPVDSEQWTQEIQLSKSVGEQRWTAGLFYYNRKIDSGTRTDLSRETFIGFPINTNTVTEDETESVAAYGQYEWDLSQTVTLVTGLRYTMEERDFHMVVTDDAGLLPNPAFAFTPETAGDLTEHDTDNYSFRAELNWTPSNNWMWYGSVSRGVKGAGFNIDLGIDPRTVEDIPFDEEYLLAYELGFKSTVANGTTRLNASVFFYDYDDYQAFSFENLSNVVSNKDGTIYGLDAELTSNPVAGLTLTAGLSLLDTEVKDINTGVSVVDREFTMSPELTANALVRYEWGTGSGTWAVQADARYQGEQYFDILNTTIAEEDAYTLVNLRADYTFADNRTTVALFVDNVTDEEYRTYAIPVPGLSFSQSMVGTPRWVGASVRYEL